MEVSGSKAGQPTARQGPAWASGLVASGRDSGMFFLNIRVTHPKASLLSRREVISQLLSHEKMKKRPYGERVTAVERGAFTPLVFSTSGMIGKECPMFLKTLACLIAENNVDFHLSLIMGHLRRRLSFCLMRWAVTCLRGSRSPYRRNRMNFFTTPCGLRAAQAEWCCHRQMPNIVP